MPEAALIVNARQHRLRSALAAALAVTLGWAALAPLSAGLRERRFDIPAGTAALLAAGGQDDNIPAEVTLTLGFDDVLLLRNFDRVSQQFGPVLLPAGEQFRLPFERTGVYPIATTARAGRRLTVTVVDWPTPGWERLSWRLARLGQHLRYLPPLPPR